MDGELFRRLYHLAGEVASKDPPPRGTHSDFAVLLTLIMAAGHDESVSWACRRGNWPAWCWRVSRSLPSPSTMGRRPHTRGFRLVLLRFDGRLRAAMPGSSLKFVDGKPLLVGGYSKDPDARRGRAPGGWAKGYKLHAVVDACGAVEAFAVTPLDAGEATVARELLVPAAGDRLRGARVLADANYDSNPLYAGVADAGGRLTAPRRKPGAGLGHRDGGAQHPHRLAAIAALEPGNAKVAAAVVPHAASAAADRALYDLRGGIEQALGLMGNASGGLRTGLPNHVRRLRRVRLWVMLKVIVYHGHLLEQDRRRAATAGRAR